MSVRDALRRAGAILLGAAFLAGAAQAEVLVLPEQLIEIGEEAFASDASITSVVIPDGAEAIGDRAFQGCVKLDRITIPASVTEFGYDILEDCAEDVLIQTEPGSAACSYAEANRIDYQADTTYRALLIGQTYEGTDDELEGPANDVKNLANCLQRFAGTPYQIVTRSDLTGSGIKAAIREVFADAGPEDVSLFYYSGHGLQASGNREMHGALAGIDYPERAAFVTANDLRSTLDEIPGRKIVLIDACFSGNMISPELASAYSVSEEPEMTAEDFVNSFMLAFGSKSRASLAAQDYFVITAASDEEESTEFNIGKNGKFVGLFTSYLVEGCGYSFKKEAGCALNADANKSGAVSIQEAYAYACEKASSFASRYGESQHAQVYPVGCDWFGFLRK